MSPQAEVLSGGIQGNFVAAEAIDSGSGFGHAHQQAHVGPTPVGQEDLHACFAVGKGRQVAHQFVARDAGEVQLLA
jgi:hypothetical protein